MVAQGEVHWIDFGPVIDSAPARVRPGLVVQSDPLNKSGLRTIMICPLTSNRTRAGIPGHVLLPAGSAGLERDSVVLVNQVSTIDRRRFREAIGRIQASDLDRVLAGIALSLGMTR